MENTNGPRRTLGGTSHPGVKLEIDDFGTGYSSRSSSRAHVDM